MKEKRGYNKRINNDRQESKNFNLNFSHWWINKKNEK